MYIYNDIYSLVVRERETDRQTDRDRDRDRDRENVSGHNKFPN